MNFIKIWHNLYFKDNPHLLKTVQHLYTTPADKLCPKMENVFRAFELVHPNELKVVMVGLDPYPQKGIATGILFGNKGISEENLSPSLRVVKDAVIDRSITHGPITFDNSLESWCKQGVLMLNSSLTCLVGQTGVHTLLWRPFMIKLLQDLSLKDNGLIFVFWGEEAKSFTKFIDIERHDVLTEKHPAWYARCGKPLSSDIFNKIDEVLIGRYGNSIEWYREDYGEQKDKECSEE